MPNDPLSSAAETFSAPLEHLIVSVAQGLAEAQKTLDENSIAMQQELDSNPAMAGYGLQATWFQFPRVDFQVKLAVSMEQHTTQTQAPPGPQNFLPPSRVSNLRLIAQPVSASYQTQFQYDASAASVLNLTIVPVPPPRPSDQGLNPARMKAFDVQAAALGSAAKFQKDDAGLPVTALRFDVMFNASARTWYVVQYDPANPTVGSVVVAVDDVTGSVRIISTP